jgi:hypothetical protein
MHEALNDSLMAECIGMFGVWWQEAQHGQAAQQAAASRAPAA